MSLTSLDDEELIKLYVDESNPRAFGEIYERYVQDVYRYAYSRMGDKEMVEDIVSETFGTLLDVLENFAYKSSLKTFIFGIALNKMRQFWSEKKIDPHVGTILDDNMVSVESFEEDDPEKEESKLELCRDLLPDVFKKLKVMEANVLEARFFEALSVRQTAERLDLTEANVRVIQHRAIKKAVEVANELLSDTDNNE